MLHIIFDRTPVHAAAFNDHIESLQMLLSSGGDVNQTDTLGRTTLMFASMNGHCGTIGMYPQGHMLNVERELFLGLLPCRCYWNVENVGAFSWKVGVTQLACVLDSHMRKIQISCKRNYEIHYEISCDFINTSLILHDPTVFRWCFQCKLPWQVPLTCSRDIKLLPNQSIPWQVSTSF